MADFDVFISYNRAEQSAVLKLATLLRDRGLKPWLDVWNLVAGEPWLPAVERALQSRATCAVIVGPSGLGGVHEHEMWTAIERSLSSTPDHGFRVIPVLLPNSTRGDRALLPSFLSRHTWVEFLKSLDESAALDAFANAIKGEPPSPAVSLPRGECPFRGLAHFEVADAPLFFGREALTDWLLSRLSGTATKQGPTRFLAIVGASGSGKSSLARAGLLASLQQGKLPGSACWPIVVSRPESRPLESLAAALANTEGVHLGSGLKSELIAQLEASLRNSPDGLHKVVLANRPADDRDWRLVLFIDQFEELFTLNPTGGSATTTTSSHLGDDRTAYVKNLLNAATIADGRTIVILTMRADFYGKCAALPELATAVSQHQELVGPMERDELRRAIEIPAKLSGRKIESGLVDLLVREVAQQSGALPLLQYALAELWNKSNEQGLTMSAYRELGGWEGALSRRADAVLAEFRNTPQEKLCRELFLRLVQLGEGTEDTKRLVRWDELKPANDKEATALEQTVRALADHRLITTGSELKSGTTLPGDATVEVVHEALIRGWGELRNWLEADRAGLRLHRQLTEAANEWAKSHDHPRQRDPSLLYTGTRLATARELARRGDVTLNELESQFVEASHQAIRSSKRRTILTWVSAALAVGVLAAVGTWFAFNQQNDARAREMVENLKNAKESQIPQIITSLESYRRWASEPLRHLYAQSEDDSSAKLHAALALASANPPVDATVIGYLRERLLVATPAQFPLVRETLARCDLEHPQQIEVLWRTASDASLPMARRFRSACALATYAPEDARWAEVAQVMSRHLVSLPAEEHVPWRQEFEPARKPLQQSIAAIILDSPKESQLRQFATETLVRYASDNGALLGETLLEADPATFEPLLAAASRVPTEALTRLQQELDVTLKPQWDDVPLDPGWAAIDAVSAEKIRKANGLIEERFAMCLSLPLVELVDLCEQMRRTGFRPISLVTWSRGEEVLISVVWTRDGADWKLRGPIDAESGMMEDAVFQSVGLRPMAVDTIPPFGRQLCILWGPPNDELRDRGTGATGSAELKRASVPTVIPMTWSLKYFRNNQGDEPPTDWKSATAGEALHEETLPYLQLNFSAESSEGLQNLLIDARASVKLDKGDYRIWAVADDGMRLFFDEKLVIDGWVDKKGQPLIATISADAGEHRLRVEHYQRNGPMVLSSHLGYPTLALVSKRLDGRDGVVNLSGTRFESKSANGPDLAILDRDIHRLISDGFRPHSVSWRPGRPGGPNVICRRPIITEESRDRLTERQGRACVAMARLGNAGVLWPRMAFQPDDDPPASLDPGLRTELIHDLAEYRVDPSVLMERLASEKEISTRRALLLALGQFSEAQLPEAQRSSLIETLLREFEAEPDAGLHGSIEWLMRKWGRGDDIQRAVDRMTPTGKAEQGHRAVENRQWYINGMGQTFAVLPAGEFWMGSPESEPGRSTDEKRHRRLIEREFAIATTEVTRAQYLKFVKSTGTLDPANQYVKTDDSAQTGIDWFEAAWYCDWLSEQEGIAPSEWCYEPIVRNEQKIYGPGMKMKEGFLDLKGYRLPTEAEWEYACRFRTASSRYYGNSLGWLGQYAWFAENSKQQIHSVGEKKPNELGLFDMLGNAMEWCHDQGGFLYPAGDDALPTLTDQSADLDPNRSRILRSSSFYSHSSLVRSGFRLNTRPGMFSVTHGFRPARTYR